MRRRLVYRGEDVGYTEAFDLGFYKVVEDGIATAADVMFDAPHAKEALLWLKERPWISVGWHRHLWESPVLPSEEVPSLVDAEGRFKWRHHRSDLKKEATYEDAYKEFKAEVEFCKQYLGRIPDTADVFDKDLPLEKAFKDVILAYGIPYNLFNRDGKGCNPEYQDKFDLKPVRFKGYGESTAHHFDLNRFDQYDPKGSFLAIEWENDQQIWKIGGHPGYLDEHILKESSCTIHRVKDVEVGIDPDLKQWVLENQIELVNLRDVVNGTSEFQDHLKEINSPLWIGNMR